MAVFIREVISELVLDAEPAADTATPGAGAGDRVGEAAGVSVDDIVRRASERVLEQLRREWDR